ncbi:hypothetical protein BH11BAC2_BH11BAC2_01320 [soil metagenome]
MLLKGEIYVILRQPKRLGKLAYFNCKILNYNIVKPKLSMKNSYKSNIILKNSPALLLALFLVIGMLLPELSKAQTLVVQTESFESTIFPAPGWRTQKGNVNPAIGGNGSVQRTPPPIIPAFPVNVGVPVGGGSNVMSYNAGVALNGDTTYVFTKPYDFSNNSGTNPTISFWMFRDGFNASSNDRIEVLINTTPFLAGATLLTNTVGTTAISRNNTFAPAVAANTWNQYTYSLPAATYNGLKYYFIIRCIRASSGPGLDMFFDLFNTNTHPSAMVPSDVSMDLIQQNFASVGTGQANQWVVGIRCVVANSSGCGNLNASMLIPPAKLDSLLLNSNGTTNVNDIQNAKIWYTGGSNIFSTAYVSPFPTVGLPAGTSYPRTNFSSTIPVIATNLDFVNPGAGPCFYLEYDTTYFWLTYDIKATATGGNLIDADFRGANVGGTGCPVALAGTGYGVVPTVFVIPGSAQVDLPYCVPTYTTGTAWAGYTNNDYVYSTFLSGALGSLINTGVQTLALQTAAAPGYPTNHFVMHPPDYEFMANVPGRTVILTQGATYSITVGCGTWFSNNVVTAWIDYDRSGTFDPTEKLGETSLAALGTTTWTFTVPGAGYVGPTRLRVREVFANSSLMPCQTYTFGECEDYVATIVPNCNPAYKLWLGNTNDWNNPANWCGGVPTIADDAVINKVLVNPTYPYFNPTIKSSVIANCKNLTIAAGDTLDINAPIPGTFKIKGDLTINGGFRVITAFNPEITYSNGTLVNNIITPFKAQSSDARTQIIYTPAELSAQGLQSGDRITGLKFNITSKGSTAAFNNFTISYGLTATNAFATTAPLATPTVVYGPAALTTIAGTFTITLSAPIVWDGTNNIVIQYCFDNAASIGATDDRLLITQTTGRNSTLLLSSAVGTNTGCSMLFPGTGVTSNFFPSLATSRPNTTFIIDRPYTKYTFRAQGQWNNNNYFSAGSSRAILDSTVAQTIGGTQVSTFHELELSKSAAANTVTLGKNLIVNDTLALYVGQLIMNQKMIDITNSTSLKAIDRTAGAIICEDNTFAAKVNWNFGTLTGLREIPFGTITYGANPVTQYIPVRINNITGVDLGTINLNTYNTIPANTPWPPTVSQLNTATGASAPGVPGANNSAFTVDRFWNLTKNGVAANPSTTMQFYFADAERPTGAPMNITNQPKAQPWNSATAAWMSFFAGTTGSFAASPNTNSSTVPNYSWPIGNTMPWAIALGQQPLPIELINFNAEIKDNKYVRLYWSTASEVDNDYFTVERTVNENEYDYIAKVNSYYHNSNTPLNYEAFDYAPVQGLQYYRLKQTDLNGDFTYSDLVPVRFGVKAPFEITNVFSEANVGAVNVEFTYDSNSPLTVTITDAAGRIVASQVNLAATVGTNVLRIPQSISRGLYFITLRNSEKVVSRKFVY